MSGGSIIPYYRGGAGIRVSPDGEISTAEIQSVPGTDQGAEIQTALDDAASTYAESGVPQTVTLGPGTFEHSEQLRSYSFVKLQGVLGETALRWTGERGNTASIENAQFVISGSIDTGILNTTPTSAAIGVNYYPSGSQAVSVASVGNAQAGDWIYYTGGNNPALQQYDASVGDMVLWGDLVQIESIAGLVLTLSDHTLSYHTVTSGASVNPIAINIKGARVIERAVIDGIIFDGGDYIAVGILSDYPVEVTISNCEFRNYSYSAIYTRFGRGFTVRGCILGGALNGFLRADAVHLLEVCDTQSRDQVERYCPVGRGYGAISIINDCAEARIYNNRIEHFSIGFNGSGFRNLQFNNNKYRDLDVVLYKQRDQATPTIYTLGVTGIGVHLGVVDLSIAYFNPGFTDIGTEIVDARTATIDTAADDCAYWLHDTFGTTIMGLGMYNRGRQYETIDGQARYMLGLRMQDHRGLVVGTTAVGCAYPLRVNTTLGGTIVDFAAENPPAQGTVPTIGLYVETGFTATRLHNIKVFRTYFDSTDMVALGYLSFIISKLETNECYFEGPGVIAQNKTGAVIPGGGVVAYDSTTPLGQRFLVRTNDGDASTAVRKAMTNQGGFGAPIEGFCFVEGFPTFGFVAVNTDPIALGDELKIDAGGAFELSPLHAGAAVATSETIKGAGIATILAGKP